MEPRFIEGHCILIETRNGIGRMTDHRQLYELADNEGKAAKRGLWADNELVPPWVWRHRSIKFEQATSTDGLDHKLLNSYKPKESMSDEDLKAELERLRNENAALKKGAAAGVSMKVSEKGAVSIYGMGRFPVTLYKEQWLKLLDMSDEIRAFIAANDARLKTKG